MSKETRARIYAIIQWVFIAYVIIAGIVGLAYPG
jgi:hypothetical protein